MADTFRFKRRHAESNRRRGAMLIITMGVLTLLAVLGTTFVSLMRMERQAARNYVDAQVVDQLNESAVERAISDLTGAANYLSYTSYSREPTWLFIMKDGLLGHGRFDLTDPRVGDWDILTQEDERVHRYKLKIIDTSAQININGRQDTVARMLENLARAIVSSSHLNRRGQDPLYTGPYQSGQRLKGTEIIEFRNKLEGRRFRSKTQLRQLIGDENYDTIKDFITVHGWEDPYTYAAADGIPEVPDFVTGQTGGPGGGGGGGVLGGGSDNNTHPQVVGPSPRLQEEPRSPININSAPEEVLVAALMGIGGRRPFPYSRLTYAPIDQGATIRGRGVPQNYEEEVQNVQPRAIWVYMPRLEYQDAQRIAQRIIAQRKNPTTQFMTWSSGQAQRPGFAEFINQLEDRTFPNPNRAIIIDPRNVQGSRRVQSEILNPAGQLGLFWRRGHDNKERQFRVRSGLPVSQQNAFWYDLVRGAIIANCNPNTRINRVNPNVGVAAVVDKSDLVTLDPQDQRTPRYGHTTDFCFDSPGIFEVTSLGDIALIDDETKQKMASVGPLGNYRFETSDHARFEPLYRKRLRTVVKVWETLRHTSQFHFEKTFQSANFSSRKDRRNVVTWPDAMEALTDVVSQGSVRDGRIELAGLKDGLRMQMSPSARVQALRSPEQIVMAHAFQDRDDSSYNQLRRLLTSGGGTGSQEYIDRLNDVLNAGYSKFNGRMRFYNPRRKVIQKFGQIVDSPWDPRVNPESLGSDLRPDGLQSSLFTQDHLGARVLHLGAHNMAGGDQVTQYAGRSNNLTGNQLVGAGRRQNNLGNVPYYNGGMAFWVKFEFDAISPVFSGLIGVSQVIEDVPTTIDQKYGSEGTQFFIFKNTKGFLRIVRMYYHQAYPAFGASAGGDGGGGGGGGEGGTGSGPLWPDLSKYVGPNAGPGAAQELADILDPLKPVARADVIIDVRHFKAHEWHHIAVDWNDSNPNNPLTVNIDFETVNAQNYIPQEGGGGNTTPTAWVRLNQRRPYDAFFVGGIVRHQAVADAGLFKWFTNTTAITNQGGVSSVEENIKRILSNATIDELITYTGTFHGVKRYYSPSGQNGYFTNQVGIYSNVMEIPLPPEVDHVVMRSIDWTSYYPSHFWGGTINRSPGGLNVTPVRMQVFSGRTVLPAFEEPWRQPNIMNRIAGRPAVRTQAKGLLGRNAELVYQLRLTPAKFAGAGQLAGGSVATPAVDDVTATYYLPNPRILYQEEEDI